MQPSRISRQSARSPRTRSRSRDSTPCFNAERKSGLKPRLATEDTLGRYGTLRGEREANLAMGVRRGRSCPRTAGRAPVAGWGRSSGRRRAGGAFTHRSLSRTRPASRARFSRRRPRGERPRRRPRAPGQRLPRSPRARRRTLRAPHHAAHPRAFPPEMRNPEKLVPLGVSFACWSA